MMRLNQPQRAVSQSPAGREVGRQDNTAVRAVPHSFIVLVVSIDKQPVGRNPYRTLIKREKCAHILKYINTVHVIAIFYKVRNYAARVEFRRGKV
jgi:hypothetical protein